jgi:3-oxoacid CoA-transferase
MIKEFKNSEKQEMIARRVAKELKGPLVVNLGIGIPTLIPKFLEDDQIYFQTENGMLGVKEVDEDKKDPNIVNAGKQLIGEDIGASYFHSADSFAMIRGKHIDVAVLGALQVDERGLVANWSVPGKNIIGVGGAMDLLEGAKRVIVSMIHVAKDGSLKIVDKCTYPITSRRRVDMIVTDLAVFKVNDAGLVLTELMPHASLEEIKEKTSARFIVDLEG